MLFAVALDARLFGNRDMASSCLVIMTLGFLSCVLFAVLDVSIV